MLWNLNIITALCVSIGGELNTALAVPSLLRRLVGVHRSTLSIFQGAVRV
jgi:hypothetical protein